MLFSTVAFFHTRVRPKVYRKLNISVDEKYTVFIVKFYRIAFFLLTIKLQSIGTENPNEWVPA